MNTFRFRMPLFAVAVFAATSLVNCAFGANPYLPLWEFIPDGEPYVFDDPDKPGEQRVYIYGSHDNRRNSYCGRDQVVWSASVKDLNRWRFDGVIFRSLLGADGKPLNKDGSADVLFASDVAVKTEGDGSKTYYLYPNTQAWGRNGQVARSKASAFRLNRDQINTSFQKLQKFRYGVAVICGDQVCVCRFAQAHDGGNVRVAGTPVLPVDADAFTARNTA